MSSEPLIFRRRSYVISGGITVGIFMAATIIVTFVLVAEALSPNHRPGDIFIALAITIGGCLLGWLGFIQPRYELHRDHVVIVSQWVTQYVDYSAIARATVAKGELFIILRGGKSLVGAAFGRTDWNTWFGAPQADWCADEINERRFESSGPGNREQVRRRVNWWNIAIVAVFAGAFAAVHVAVG
ncbi:hypothetical protein [Salininema proteolyticum]|uniref:PH domain-containing protein n=1 Tax=Salininema proteolyticum TaxID=1607685 RepID=A0ABV8TZC5_9ACTN